MADDTLRNRLAVRRQALRESLRSSFLATGEHSDSMAQSTTSDFGGNDSQYPPEAPTEDAAHEFFAAEAPPVVVEQPRPMPLDPAARPSSMPPLPPSMQRRRSNLDSFRLPSISKEEPPADADAAPRRSSEAVSIVVEHVDDGHAHDAPPVEAAPQPKKGRAPRGGSARQPPLPQFDTSQAHIDPAVVAVTPEEGDGAGVGEGAPPAVHVHADPDVPIVTRRRRSKGLRSFVAQSETSDAGDEDASPPTPNENVDPSTVDSAEHSREAAAALGGLQDRIAARRRKFQEEFPMKSVGEGEGDEGETVEEEPAPADAGTAGLSEAIRGRLELRKKVLHRRELSNATETTDTALESSKGPERLLRGRRTRHRATRFDQSGGDDTLALSQSGASAMFGRQSMGSAALLSSQPNLNASRQAAPLRWQMAATQARQSAQQQSKKDVLEPTADEALAFFTAEDAYPDFTHDEEGQEGAGAQPAEGGAEIASGDGTPAQPSASQGDVETGGAQPQDGESAAALALREVTGLAWEADFTVEMAPDVFSTTERVAAFNTHLFVVTSRPSPLEDRLFLPTALREGDGGESGMGVGKAEPRYLEDEGIFVGVRPDMTRWNVNRIENRLLMDGIRSRGWFGEDGHVRCMPDPLRKVPSRAPLAPTPFDGRPFELVKVPPLPRVRGEAFPTEPVAAMSDGDVRYQLSVDVSALQFEDHPLFTREHVLARELSAMYQRYLSRRKESSAAYLNDRLVALREAAAHISLELSREGILASEALRLKRMRREYLREMRQTRQRRDAEEHADIQLVEGMAAVWMKVREEREKAGMSTTPVRLRIAKVPCDAERDRERLARDLEDEIAEARADYDAEYEARMEEHARFVEEVENARRARLAKGAIAGGTAAAGPRQIVEGAVYERPDKEPIAASSKERRRKGSSEASRDDDTDASVVVASSSAAAAVAGKAGGEDSSSVLARAEDAEEARVGDGTMGWDAGALAGARDEIPAAPQYEFDERAVRAAARAAQREMRRAPGEPELVPEVSDTHPVTPTEECRPHEVKRRAAVDAYACHVRLLFNGKEVARTEARPLSHDFSVYFGEVFDLQVRRWPESLSLQVFESGTAVDTHLADVFLAVPGVESHVENTKHENFEFGSDRRVLYDWDHDPESVHPHVRYLRGYVTAAAAWGVDEDDSSARAPPHPPPSQTAGQLVANATSATNPNARFDALAALGATGMVNIHKLCEWVRESKLDPNDPRNASLLRLMQSYPGAEGGRAGQGHFRLRELERDCEFPDAMIYTSKRYRLLQMRRDGLPEYRTLKYVPLLEDEIDSAMMDGARAADDAETRTRREGEDKELDPRVVESSEFLRSVRNTMLVRFRNAKPLTSLQDVVVEQPLPNIKIAFGTLKRFLAPRRPLRPQRRERKKLATQTPESVKIIIRIVRAFNVPVRTQSSLPRGAAPSIPFGGGAGAEGEGNDADASQAAAALSTLLGDGMAGSVRPYIEVRFQGGVRRTHVSDGPNAQWNEELELSFTAPDDDYSPQSLSGVDDKVYFNLFDEVVVDILRDDRQRETNIHQRLERRWLGSLSLPFSTIYQNGRVDGTFHMESPVVLLGYERARTRQTAASLGMPAGEDAGFDGDSLDDSVANTKTFVNFFVTIEPPLKQVKPVRERLPSNEERRLLQYASYWTSQLQSKHPHRIFKTTAVDISGRLVFICRYIRPQAAPPELTSDHKLARFVSLIPSLNDAVTFTGDCDLWSTSDQFLDMLAGDEEEHAILLCNFFLERGTDAYVVVGSGIPEGPTSYVLTVERGKYRLWNACTGMSYRQNDTSCPLLDIGCIFNDKNIWANTQRYAEPSRVDFNVSNAKNWRPFFSRKFPFPGLSSVQVDRLRYFPTDPALVQRIEVSIEKTLSARIEEWRERFVTRWNRHCNRAFKAILPRFEELRNTVDVAQQSELTDVLRSYSLNGFPINITWTDMRAVVDAVRNTGVHHSEDPSVEFALAVHVCPYPNNILSVWIYVATLIKK